jgi:hypothetical protein
MISLVKCCWLIGFYVLSEWPLSGIGSRVLPQPPLLILDKGMSFAAFPAHLHQPCPRSKHVYFLLLITLLFTTVHHQITWGWYGHIRLPPDSVCRNAVAGRTSLWTTGRHVWQPSSSCAGPCLRILYLLHDSNCKQFCDAVSVENTRHAYARCSR